MKTLLLITALITALLLMTSCSNLKNYRGPSMRFSVGFDGIDVGITILGQKGMTQKEMLDRLNNALPEIPGIPITATK